MKPLTRLFTYVLEQSAQEPLPKRIGIYRDLAAISGTAKQAAHFIQMADELEAIQQRHEQLLLNLKQGGRR